MLSSIVACGSVSEVCGYFVMVIAEVCSSFFFFSSRRRHTRFTSDWSSDVCSSDLVESRAARGLPFSSKRNTVDDVLEKQAPGRRPCG